MVSWYALAEVCYVYLEDVKDGDSPDDEDSGFQRLALANATWALIERSSGGTNWILCQHSGSQHASKTHCLTYVLCE